MLAQVVGVRADDDTRLAACRLDGGAGDRVLRRDGVGGQLVGGDRIRCDLRGRDGVSLDLVGADRTVLDQDTAVRLPQEHVADVHQHRCGAVGELHTVVGQSSNRIIRDGHGCSGVPLRPPAADSRVLHGPDQDVDISDRAVLLDPPGIGQDADGSGRRPGSRRQADVQGVSGDEPADLPVHRVHDGRVYGASTASHVRVGQPVGEPADPTEGAGHVGVQLGSVELIVLVRPRDGRCRVRQTGGVGDADLSQCLLAGVAVHDEVPAATDGDPGGVDAVRLDLLGGYCTSLDFVGGDGIRLDVTGVDGQRLNQRAGDGVGHDLVAGHQGAVNDVGTVDDLADDVRVHQRFGAAAHDTGVARGIPAGVERAQPEEPVGVVGLVSDDEIAGTRDGADQAERTRTGVAHLDLDVVEVHRHVEAVFIPTVPVHSEGAEARRDHRVRRHRRRCRIGGNEDVLGVRPCSLEVVAADGSHLHGVGGEDLDVLPDPCQQGVPAHGALVPVPRPKLRPPDSVAGDVLVLTASGLSDLCPLRGEQTTRTAKLIHVAVRRQHQPGDLCRYARVLHRSGRGAWCRTRATRGGGCTGECGDLPLNPDVPLSELVAQDHVACQLLTVHGERDLPNSQVFHHGRLVLSDHVVAGTVVDDGQRRLATEHQFPGHLRTRCVGHLQSAVGQRVQDAGVGDTALRHEVLPLTPR